MNKGTIRLLVNIWRNDKTVYSYDGKDRGNRDGKDNPEKGTRWSTPREMVEDYINYSKDKDTFWEAVRGEITL